MHQVSGPDPAAYGAAAWLFFRLIAPYVIAGTAIGCLFLYGKIKWNQWLRSKGL